MYLSSKILSHVELAFGAGTLGTKSSNAAQTLQLPLPKLISGSRLGRKSSFASLNIPASFTPANLSRRLAAGLRQEPLRFYI